MSHACINLKKGRDRSIRQGHHWVFSGAVAAAHDLAEGGTAQVRSAEGELLGTALVSPGRSILASLLARGDQTLEDALRWRIGDALALRKSLPIGSNAVRLIHAEGDGIPGLIADQYDDVAVLQLSHPSLEPYRELIASLLPATTVYEKSTSALRKKLGGSDVRALLKGPEKPHVEVIERGMKLSVDLLQGQKTGLFLDQREMRSLIRTLAYNRRVLNCFSYTGAFTVAALMGGAASALSVDVSEKCGPALEKNLALNNLQAPFIASDAADFIRNDPLQFDLVILDPPAYAKKQADVPGAFRAYKDLNRAALAKMPAGSLLLTCSCSAFVNEELFQNILFRAAHEAGRSVRILERHRQALDHPVSLFHPETAYLKSFLLYIA